MRACLRRKTITGPQWLKHCTDDRHKRDSGCRDPGHTETVEHAGRHRHAIAIRLLRLAVWRVHVMVAIGHGHGRRLRHAGKTGCCRQHRHRQADHNDQDQFCDTHPRPLLPSINSHVNDKRSLINIKADHAELPLTMAGQTKDAATSRIPISAVMIRVLRILLVAQSVSIV